MTAKTRKASTHDSDQYVNMSVWLIISHTGELLVPALITHTKDKDGERKQKDVGDKKACYSESSFVDEAFLKAERMERKFIS